MMDDFGGNLHLRYKLLITPYSFYMDIQFLMHTKIVSNQAIEKNVVLQVIL